MRSLAFLFVLLAGFTAGSLAHANVDSCDDYLSRHYKKDLKPIGLSFQDRDYMGDIYFPHQAVTVRVRNVGQEPMPGSQSEFARMRVRVAGISRNVQIRRGLPSMQDTYIKFSLPPGTLHHCDNHPVWLDTARNVGQWGCRVFGNDNRSLKAVRYPGFCRYIPFPRP